MKKIVTEKGHIAYKTSIEEVMSWGGMGICDHCNEFHPEGGFVVPVLNHWICQRCFDEWVERAIYYEEDEWFEKKVSKYYESIIPLE